MQKVHYFPSRQDARKFAAMNGLRVTDKGAEFKGGKRWQVVVQKQEIMKLSDLFIAAKAILLAREETYICNALDKADGSFNTNKPESELCKKAKKIVVRFTVAGGWGSVYDHLVSDLFGMQKSLNASYNEFQAGRLRLVDFIISECLAWGE